MAELELDRYPGGDLVAKGLQDLANDTCSREALLVLIASPRLNGLGFSIVVPSWAPTPFEDALYFAIAEENPRGAHSAYNALIRRIVSFAQAYSLANRP